MKTIFYSLLIGIVVAIAGLIFAEAFSTVVNGLDRDTSRIIGMMSYVCIVLVTCTGVILSKLAKSK